MRFSRSSGWAKRYYFFSALFVIFAVPVQRSHANAVFKETYLILNGGPQAGDYYYEGLDAGGSNVTINSVNGSINLLSGSLTLKGGEVKTTMSGGDYQNGNNWMKMYYRFYDQTESVPAYSEQSISFLQENPYPENLFRTSNASTNLLSGNDSGVYKLDVYWDGNASYFSGGQQYFDMNQTSTYTATFTLFYGATTTATQGSAFTGTGYFNFNGSGQTYTLNSGSNNYTGETQVQAGTVLLSGSGTVASSSVVKIAASSTFDISAVTASSTTVKGVSEYGGSNGGSVKLGSKKLVISGGTGTQFFNVLGINGDTGSFELNDADTTLSLYGNSLYTGATTLTAGTLTTSGTMASASFTLGGGNLTISADNRLSDSASVTVNSGTFTANGSDTIGILSGTGGIVSVASGKSLTTTISGAASYSGVITGSGNLVKDGAGTLTLDGSSANNFSGTTTVKGGILVLAKTGGANGLAGTPTINTGATIRLGLGNQFSGDSTFLTIDSGGTFDLNGYNETLAIQGGGSITLNGGTITINPTLTDVFSGSISGSGGVTKANSGTQVLSGSSSYTGVTTVSGGSLEVRHGSALGASGAGQGTTVSSGAVLTYSNATSISVAEGLTLNGSGVSGIGGALKNVSGSNTQTGGITLDSSARIAATGGSLAIQGNIGGGNNVLYLGTDGGSISISSVISGAGATQSGTTTSLFKDGTGTLTLTGANTYSGDTRITQGALTVGSGGNLGNGDSDVFISSGATLNVNANATVDSVQETATSNGGVISIGTGATLTIDGVNKGTFFQNNISGAGNLRMAGSGTTSLGLYGTQDYTGTTTVSNGTLSTGVALSTSGLILDGGVFETTGANIISSSSSVTINGGEFKFGNDSTDTDVVGVLAGTGGKLTLNAQMTTTSNTDSSYAGNISGSQGMVKQGTGILTLTGVSDGTGSFFIDQGGINLNLASGSIGNRSIDIGGGAAGNSVNTSAATLRVTSGSYNNTITINSEAGPASAASGNRTIDFANTSGTATLSGSVALEKATTVSVASGGAGELTGAVTGAGGISKSGSGRLTLNNANNTYSGGTTLSAGQLRLAHQAAAGTGTITQSDGTSTLEIDTTGTVANAMNIYNVSTLKTVTLSGNKTLNNATYDVAASTTTTESGALSGSGGITKNGAGTLVVSGSSANTFTGASSVNAGTLKLEKSGGATAISGSSIAINGGTLLLGAANQIGDTTGITMSGGTLGMGGFNDTAGKLSVSANSIFDFDNTGAGTSTFTFSDFDTATYGGVAGLTMQNVNIGSRIVFNTNYSGNSTFNTFTTKISFSDTQLMNQISFSGGTTTLTVAAIPEPKVYMAAGALALLIGFAEVRRRRKSVSSKA